MTNNNTAPAAVTLSGITKSFPVKKVATPAVAGLSLTIDPGDFVSLIGPSGCGKSTLFNIIMGLEPADSGTVLIGGTPVESPLDAAALCSYMPQDDVLFPWRDVIDNAIIGMVIDGVSRRDARAKAHELLPLFGLSDFAHERPEHLSGGMRQRVSLLRTILREKKILLLDEPFAALDSLTRTDMQQWLKNICRQFGVTVLLITHDVREAVRLSDRVIAFSPRPAMIVADLRLDAGGGQWADVRARAEHPSIEDAERTLTRLLHGHDIHL